MFTIGIAGRSGAGKSRVADELARLCPHARVLATDSYYRDLSAVAPAERSAVNFDAPEALDWDLLLEHLGQLQAGGEVVVPRYDFETHARQAQGTLLGPGDMLVLEGLFALCDERVRARLDLAVFVDVDEGECLRRRIERDTGSRGRQEASVRAQWERDVAPMYALHVSPVKASADLLLDGSAAPIDSAWAILSAAGRSPAGPESRSLHSKS